MVECRSLRERQKGWEGAQGVRLRTLDGPCELKTHFNLSLLSLLWKHYLCFHSELLGYTWICCAEDDFSCPINPSELGRTAAGNPLKRDDMTCRQQETNGIWPGCNLPKMGDTMMYDGQTQICATQTQIQVASRVALSGPTRPRISVTSRIMKLPAMACTSAAAWEYTRLSVVVLLFVCFICVTSITSITLYLCFMNDLCFHYCHYFPCYCNFGLLPSLYFIQWAYLSGAEVCLGTLGPAESPWKLEVGGDCLRMASF